MRRLIDIDLLDDEALQGELMLASLAIALCGAVVGLLMAVGMPHEAIDPLWFLGLGIVSVLALPVHELVHALAFGLMSGFTAHISFGFTQGMLYTRAVGTMLPRRRFCVVLLAPAVVVTAALGVGAWAWGYPLMGWFLAVVHLSGCTGDLAYVRIIASEPTADLVEDTERGIALFSK